MSGVVRDVFQRSLEETEIVDITDNQFRLFPLRIDDVGRV